MAGVFKGLDRSDIRLTPFRAHKLISLTGSAQLDSIIYQADYNPQSSPANSIHNVFDQGNPMFEADEPTTVNDHYQRVVHRSLDHLYYRDFYSNTKAAFGQGDINYQHRFLEDKAQIISLPQTKFGEGIQPGSVRVYATYSIANVSAKNVVLIDDNNGNLKVSGSLDSYYSFEVSGSVDKQLVGDWLGDRAYTKLGHGLQNFTSSLTRGQWPMMATYNNVEAVELPTFSPPRDQNLVGAGWQFSKVYSSRVEISCQDELHYQQAYNFENEDFAISAYFYPTANSLNPSGSVIVAKHGPSQRLQTDINGNPFVENTTHKTPYRLLWQGNKFVFERSNLHDQLQLVATGNTLNRLHHVVVNKTGSLFELWVDGSLIDSGSDISGSAQCSNHANIYLGDSHDYAGALDGVIDSVKMYRGALTVGDINILQNTYNAGNLNVGNVFYNHGMITLTSNITRFMQIQQVEARATQTIYETEISCTVAPGEFNMSSNRSLQVYEPSTNQYVYRPFISSSAFRPFVTTIGLYNKESELLAIGKLTSPVQTPTNTDTTFIVRFDRW